MGFLVGRRGVPGGGSVKRELKVLGVVFSHNWDLLFERVSRWLDMWLARPLALSGSVVATKANILPMVNHVAYVPPPPFFCGEAPREGSV